MDKKLTIKESFNLGKGWNLMIFAILAMLVTNAGVNDGLNIALPEIAKGAGLDYELCLSMGTVAGFVGVAMMLVIAKFRDRFGGRKVSAALFIIFGFTFYFLFLRASNIVMYAISQCIMVSCVGLSEGKWSYFSNKLLYWLFKFCCKRSCNENYWKFDRSLCCISLFVPH